MCSKLRTMKHYLGITVLRECRELLRRLQYVKNKMDLNLGDERRKGGQRESKKKLMRFEPTIFSTAMLIYYIGTGYWTNSSDSRTGWTAAQQPFVRTANGLVWQPCSIRIIRGPDSICDQQSSNFLFRGGQLDSCATLPCAVITNTDDQPRRNLGNPTIQGSSCTLE